MRIFPCTSLLSTPCAQSSMSFHNLLCSALIVSHSSQLVFSFFFSFCSLFVTSFSLFVKKSLLLVVTSSLFSPIFHAITQAICLTHFPALEKGRGHRGSRKKEKKRKKRKNIGGKERDRTQAKNFPAFFRKMGAFTAELRRQIRFIIEMHQAVLRTPAAREREIGKAWERG